MDYYGKPYINSIKKVIKKLDIDIKSAIFIDDSFENIISAKYLGFKTIYIYKDSEYMDYYEDFFFPKIRSVLI
jgi:FMN phosphatase YigB (HAD superfamily)